MKIKKVSLDGRDVQFTNGIWFYVQPGGCLEIGQQNGENDHDLVHVCNDDIRAFMSLLNAHVNTWCK